MKIDAKISILVGQDSTRIEVFDQTSRTAFLRILLTPQQLSAALSRSTYTSCDSAEVIGLDVVGKKQEIDTMCFQIPNDYSNCSKKYEPDYLYNLALNNVKDGWQPDNYFSAQNTFFEKDGVKYARCTIRRWIEFEINEP